MRDIISKFFLLFSQLQFLQIIPKNVSRTYRLSSTFIFVLNKSILKMFFANEDKGCVRIKYRFSSLLFEIFPESFGILFTLFFRNLDLL